MLLKLVGEKFEIILTTKIPYFAKKFGLLFKIYRKEKKCISTKYAISFLSKKY